MTFLPGSMKTRTSLSGHGDVLGLGRYFVLVRDVNFPHEMPRDVKDLTGNWFATRDELRL